MRSLIPKSGLVETQILNILGLAAASPSHHSTASAARIQYESGAQNWHDQWFRGLFEIFRSSQAPLLMNINIRYLMRSTINTAAQVCQDLRCIGTFIRSLVLASSSSNWCLITPAEMVTLSFVNKVQVWLDQFATLQRVDLKEWILVYTSRKNSWIWWESSVYLVEYWSSPRASRWSAIHGCSLAASELQRAVRCEVIGVNPWFTTMNVSPRKYRVFKKSQFLKNRLITMSCPLWRFPIVYGFLLYCRIRKRPTDHVKACYLILW